MNSKTLRNWGITLGLFCTTSAGLTGCQSKAFAPETSVLPQTEFANTVPFSLVPPNQKNASPAYPPVSMINTSNKIQLFLANISKFCDPKKYAYIIVDALTGEEVAGKNENTPRHPASLTKLMTLFLTFEAIERHQLKMEDVLKIDSMDQRKGIALLRVTPNDRLNVKKAAQALGTRSANDCANILATNIAGNMDKFVLAMNERAKSLGMDSTHFTNPSGLPDPDQITTAHDMAILTQALQTYFPKYCEEILGIKEMEICLENAKSLKNPTGYYKIKTHALAKGSDMGKTGLSDASGSNIFSSFPVGPDQRYNIIIFGGKNAALRNQHDIQLFNEARKLMQKKSASIDPSLINHTDKLSALPMKREITELAPLSSLQTKLFVSEWEQTLDATNRNSFSFGFTSHTNAPKLIIQQ